MKLTEAQQNTVRSWVLNGDGLAEVQKKLADQMDIRMTFRDVRFLVDDLNVDLVDPQSSKGARIDPKTLENKEPEWEDGVSVEVDTVQRPGAMISGSVKFSDGHRMQWQIDQTGRLGLIPSKGGSDYKPTPEDIREFQVQLQTALRSKGFA